MAQYVCPKCDGKRTIAGFGHVLSGVCFKCHGTGVVHQKPRKEVVRPLTPYQQRRIDLITHGDLEALSWAELSDLRATAHWHYPQVPNLLAIWRERGEPLFQAMQAERLEAYARREGYA